VDWYVILTPLLVLPVVLLLGFTGCHELFDLEEVPPPPPPPSHLVLKVRIPSFLTVELCRFGWTPPGSTVGGNTMTVERTDEGATFVLSHLIEDVEAGSWSATCRLRVQDTTRQGDQTGSINFMLMPAEGSTSTLLFETTGRPDTTDFRVIGVGLIP